MRVTSLPSRSRHTVWSLASASISVAGFSNWTRPPRIARLSAQSSISFIIISQTLTGSFLSMSRVSVRSAWPWGTRYWRRSFPFSISVASRLCVRGEHQGRLRLYRYPLIWKGCCSSFVQRHHLHDKLISHSLTLWLMFFVNFKLNHLIFHSLTSPLFFSPSSFPQFSSL